MSGAFSLKIISATRVFFTGRCQSIILPGYDGQKEILAHHENMVIAVDEGEMRFLPEGGTAWQYTVVGNGFVEIINNRVTLLVQSVERPEEIDLKRAEEAKERALEKSRQQQSIRELSHAGVPVPRHDKASGRTPEKEGVNLICKAWGKSRGESRDLTWKNN